MRILVVEDEDISRLTVKEILREHGEMVFAKNGLEAISHFEKSIEVQWPFDLILMDINMPVMDGQSALIHIRAIEEWYGLLGLARVKVLLLSGVGRQELAEKAFFNECNGYLEKPIVRPQLLQAIKELGFLRDRAS